MDHPDQLEIMNNGGKGERGATTVDGPVQPTDEDNNKSATLLGGNDKDAELPSYKNEGAYLLSTKDIKPETTVAEEAAQDRVADRAHPSDGNIRAGDTLKLMNKAFLGMEAYDGELVRALEPLADGSWLVGLLRYGCEIMIVVKPQDLIRP